jgi:hypothetical protein
VSNPEKYCIDSDIKRQRGSIYNTVPVKRPINAVNAIADAGFHAQTQKFRVSNLP